MNTFQRTIEVSVYEPTTIVLGLQHITYAVVSGYPNNKVFAMFYIKERASEYIRNHLPKGRIINISTGEIIHSSDK